MSRAQCALPPDSQAGRLPECPRSREPRPMFPLGQHLALSSPWWSWDCTAIRKALWASVLVRLRRLGNDRLKANGAAGRSPGSWKELEFLRRDAKTHRRMFDGKTNLCLELLLGYAGVLGIDAG